MKVRLWCWPILSHKSKACRTTVWGPGRKIFSIGMSLDVDVKWKYGISHWSEHARTCILKKVENTDSPRHFSGKNHVQRPKWRRSIPPPASSNNCTIQNEAWEDVEAALKPIQDLVANSQGGAKLLSGCFNEMTSTSWRWISRKLQIGTTKPDLGWDPSFPFISYLKKWNTLPFWGQGVGGNPWFEGFTTGADAMPLAVQTLSVVTRRRVDASLGVPVRNFSSISAMTAWQLNLLCAWILTWSKLFKEDGFQLLYELHCFIVHILECLLLYWFGRLAPEPVANIGNKVWGLKWLKVSIMVLNCHSTFV